MNKCYKVGELRREEEMERGGREREKEKEIVERKNKIKLGR